jgi:hypothetical protein
MRGQVTAMIVLRAMVQLWLKDQLEMSEDDRKYFAKVDGTELITLQSKADVAAKFPSFHPLVQIMLAQNVASAVAAWAVTLRRRR